MFEGGINFIFITLHIDEKRGIKVIYALTQRDIDKLNFRIFDSNIIEMQQLALKPNVISLINKSLNKFGKIVTDEYGCKKFIVPWVFNLKVNVNQVEPVQRPTDYVDKPYNNASNMSNNPAAINIYNVTVNKTINIDKSRIKSVSYSDGCNYRRDRRMDYIRAIKLPKPASHRLSGRCALSLF